MLSLLYSYHYCIGTYSNINTSGTQVCEICYIQLEEIDCGHCILSLIEYNYCLDHTHVGHWN